MNALAFRKPSKQPQVPENPEHLFRDQRAKIIDGPYSNQADIWREFQKTAVESPDVLIVLVRAARDIFGLANSRHIMFNEIK
jgi:hypothetical protein